MYLFGLGTRKRSSFALSWCVYLYAAWLLFKSVLLCGVEGRPAKLRFGLAVLFNVKDRCRNWTIVAINTKELLFLMPNVSRDFTF